MNIPTPLEASLSYVKILIENARTYWDFHVCDLAIDFFGKSFPEQRSVKSELIDLKTDKYHETFNRTKFEA